MKTYLKRLKHHPGVPIASAFSATGFLMGFIERGLASGILTGVLASLIVWTPVLITARTQPIPEEAPNVEDTA